MPGKLVGLMGAPGAGKTTCAAWLFAQMRISGIKCELAFEFAKDLFWDDSNAWKDQLYVFANQWRMIDRVLCRTDYVVTDSPPLLSLFYNRPHSDAFVRLVLEKCSQFDTLLFLLKRSVPYDSIGRRETEDEANNLHEEMSKWLNVHGIKHEIVDSTIDGWNFILKRLKDARQDANCILQA